MYRKNSKGGKKVVCPIAKDPYRDTHHLIDSERNAYRSPEQKTDLCKQAGTDTPPHPLLPEMAPA